MVYYGPWETQTPISRERRTLERWATANNHATFGPNDTGWGDPDVPLEVRRSAMQDATDAVLNPTPVNYLDATFADFTVWQSLYESTGLYGDPPVRYQYSSKATRAYNKIRPDFTLPNVDPATYPSGAIGYEWEKNAAGEYAWTIEGATVDYAIYGYLQGSYGGYATGTGAFRMTTDADVLTASTSPPDSAFTLVSLFAVEAPVLQVGSLALSSAELAGANGALGLTVKFDDVRIISPVDRHGYGDAVKIAGWIYPDSNVNGNQAYIRVTYSQRPPRRRWVYDVAPPRPGLPPLRQLPRRDGLGSSSARRHYPPDRSAQASSRRAGGYF